MYVRNNLIAVPLPHDKRDLAIGFPKHKVIADSGGREFLVVPRQIEYALELKRLGLTKADLTRNFHYLGRYRPYQHQKITVEFLISNPRLFCLNDMGTGKTASCIWAAEFLRQAGLVKRVVIVSLISCMRSVWANELFNIAMHRHVEIAYGNVNERRYAIDATPDYLIINPDGVKVVLEELQLYKPDLVIIDEASAYKHHTTQRFKALHKLIKDDTRVWLLTGTPTATAPTDAYGLIKLINPLALPMSFAQFRNEIMIRISQFKWMPKTNAIDTVLRYMQPAIRFSKADCLDMPPVTYIYRQTRLSDEQQRAFDAMRNFMRIERSGGEPITAVNAAVKLTKLMQICLGAIYDEDKKQHILDSSPRLDELDAILDEAGEKCIIFVPYRSIVTIVEQHLSKRFKIAVVTGDTNESTRRQIFHDFQNADEPIHLLAHPQTTSHGLSLTRSCNTIWYGPYNQPEYYIQANNRTDRPGQTRPVNIIHISATDFERKLYDALQDKKHFQDRLLDIYGDLTD